MPTPHPDTERLYWSPERIRSYQLDCLRETVERAGRSAFYPPRLQGVRIESLDDLRQIPITSKEDIRQASPWGLVAVPREELFQYHESFGTTGTPASSWLTRDDFHSYATQINHAAVGFHPGDRVLVRFPFAISVPAHIFTQAARLRGACVIPASSRTAISPHSRIIDLLRKLEATVIGGLPMEAIWLAETARLLGFDSRRDFPDLRAICTAGELLSNARRDRIADLWQCQVFNMYGCTEAGNIAADCEHGRLHLSWDHFLFEVLDPESHQPVPPGEMGLAVVTTLTRQAMPLLRYYLGDYVRLIDSHCPCGRQSPVVDHFGRDLNCFTFGERRFFLRDLEDRLLTSPPENLGNLWLVEVGTADVCFRVEAEHADRNCYRRLEEQVRVELDLPLRIEAVAPGTLLNRSRLLQRQPVGKPRVIGQRQTGDSPLTLDALMG